MGKNSPRKPKTSSRFAFSARLLKLLTKSKVPFRVGGTCAMNIYVGMERQTKDLDIFCRAGDYPRLLQAAAAAGFETEIEDERWIAKIRKGKHFCDVIFGSTNTATPVTNDWFQEIHTATLWNVK